MTVIVKVVKVALMLLGVTTSATAAESTFPDIQHILDEGKLVVAILAKDAPPMIMTDGDGAVVGYEVDLALDIGKKMGVRIEFVRTAQTYDGVVELVARKEADLAVSFLTSDVRRATRVLFSQPYLTQKRRVFYNRAGFARLKRDFGINTIDEVATIATPVEFGTVKGSVYEAMLRRDWPTLRVKPYGNLAEIFAAVGKGEIFAGLHGELEIEFYMRENPRIAIYVAVEPRIIYTSDIRIAVRPDAPNLLHWVNIYLANHIGLLDTADIIERYEKAHGVTE